MIDLHMHTVLSDGASEPEALVQALFLSGIRTFAVTDHDNVQAFPRLQAQVEIMNQGLEPDAQPMTLIPGIEINTLWERGDFIREVHILGYFIDGTHAGLQEIMTRHQGARYKQIQQLVENINHKTNANLSFEAILEKAGNPQAVGRPHVAEALVEKKVVRSVNQAFEKYLKPHCPTFVRRDVASPHDAVDAIYESGGIPVVAHPGDMAEMESLIQELMCEGLRGLEAYHTSHNAATIEYYCSLAEKLGLFVTGGTDYHGLPEGYGAQLARISMPHDKIQRSLMAERHARLQFTMAGVTCLDYSKSPDP